MSRSALELLARYFTTRATRAGWLARVWLSQRARDDHDLREQLVAGLLARAGADGSVAGSMVVTAVTAIELDDLGERSAGRDRLVNWLLSRQRQGGAFPEGCTAARHRHRVCEHFLDGFFAPAPPTHRVAPITVPNGREYRSESQARFVTSCLALEAVVRGGRSGEPWVERHLASFGSLLEEWSTWSDYLAPDLAFAAIAALASAGPGWGGALEPLVALVVARQRGDGTWPQVDLFNALDGLTRVETSLARPALVRAIPALLRRQREDGSFGSHAADERALIGLRVLLAVD